MKLKDGQVATSVKYHEHIDGVTEHKTFVLLSHPDKYKREQGWVFLDFGDRQIHVKWAHLQRAIENALNLAE